MLTKMGWKEGEGLGSANQGIVNPVEKYASVVLFNYCLTHYSFNSQFVLIFLEEMLTARVLVWVLNDRQIWIWTMMSMMLTESGWCLPIDSDRTLWSDPRYSMKLSSIFISQACNRFNRVGYALRGRQSWFPLFSFVWSTRVGMHRKIASWPTLAHLLATSDRARRYRVLLLACFLTILWPMTKKIPHFSASWSLLRLVICLVVGSTMAMVQCVPSGLISFLLPFRITLVVTTTEMVRPISLKHFLLLKSAAV